MIPNLKRSARRSANHCKNFGQIFQIFLLPFPRSWQHNQKLSIALFKGTKPPLNPPQRMNQIQSNSENTHADYSSLADESKNLNANISSTFADRKQATIIFNGIVGPNRTYLRYIFLGALDGNDDFNDNAFLNIGIDNVETFVSALSDPFSLR